MAHSNSNSTARANAVPAAPRPKVARWDGQVVDADEVVDSIAPDARGAMETWRRFAERRGYRIDLDPSQRALVVSDAKRFESFKASSLIMERVLDELDPLIGSSEAPVVLLRASSKEDLETARRAADALELDIRFGAYLETGKLSDRRAVDARLAEELASAAFGSEAPRLSAWMRDGLSSLVAARTTGRAIVEGEVRTLKEIRFELEKRYRRETERDIDLLEISGARAAIDHPNPMEAEALAVVACLADHYGAILPKIVAELGSSSPPPSRAKYRQEEATLETFLGEDALHELQVALGKGKRYRRRP